MDGRLGEVLVLVQLSWVAEKRGARLLGHHVRYLLVRLKLDIVHHHLQLLKVWSQVVLLIQIWKLLHGWVGSLQGVLDIRVLVKLVELQTQTVQTQLLVEALQVVVALVELSELVLLQTKICHELSTLDELLVEQLWLKSWHGLMDAQMTWNHPKSLWLALRLRSLVSSRWGRSITLVDLFFLGRCRLHALQLLFGGRTIHRSRAIVKKFSFDLKY